MSIRTSRLILIGAAAVAWPLAAQSVQVEGTARERSGTLLNGVLVTVKDSNGKILGLAVTNVQGGYSSKAVPGKLSVECKAIEIEPVVYSRNPVVEDLTIPPNTNVGKQDCTFDQVTTESAYWMQVGKRVGDKAEKTGDTASFEAEWKQINASGLPPDSKAAAAKQWEKMAVKIDDPTFKAYTKVDEPTLTRAISGDSKALASLPPTVAADVKSQVAKQQ